MDQGSSPTRTPNCAACRCHPDQNRNGRRARFIEWADNFGGPAMNALPAIFSTRGGRIAATALASIVGGLALAAAAPGNKHDGQSIFRFDTFGDEQLWTDVLRMHEVVQ